MIHGLKKGRIDRFDDRLLCGTHFETTVKVVVLIYNLASLSGPNSARARAHLTLSLMKQFRSNRPTLH